MVSGTPPCNLFHIFTKRDHFYDFLFASLCEQTLLKGVGGGGWSAPTGKNCLIEEQNSFLYELSPFKRSKSEASRVAPSESSVIHFY